MASRLDPPRRIITANLPLPSSMKDLVNPEPAVQVVAEALIQYPELEGNAYRGTVYTHDNLPTNNDGLYRDKLTE